MFSFGQLDKYRGKSTADSGSGSGSTSGVEYRERERDSGAEYRNREMQQPGPYEGPYDARGEYRVDYDERERGRDEDRDREREQGREREGEREGGRVPSWLEATSPFVPPPPPPPGFRDEEGGGRGRGRRRDDRDDRGGRGARGADGRGLEGRGAEGGAREGEGGGREGEGGERAVAQRSRWQAMLLEAGGLSAALSDESMRRLRYCLQWLQYATQHIDAQILILRDFIASLHPLPPPGQGGALAVTTAPAEEPELTPEHLRTLAHLRRDIVHTIRQVVGVVSKYAGGALPEPARGRVRGFILDLPKRFTEGAGSPVGGGPSSAVTGAASGVGVGTGTGTAARRGMRRERGAGAESRPGSPGPSGSAPASPRAHLRPLHPHAPAGGHSRRPSASAGAGVEPGKAMAAAQRVLTLATESLDMMRGVTAVVGDSLDRADAWVDRLRTVGIQRGMDGLALPEGGQGQWASGASASSSVGESASPGYGRPRSPTAGYSHSGATSPGYASASGGAASPGYASAPSPYAGAPSPGFGLGGMSLGARGEDERERGEARMEVDG
ncbi:transcription factor Opi1-domain-containing protein [Mycena latifolia]|nr:transcription factor Opi1-domain-containing protein [Mycena latifolia]